MHDDLAFIDLVTDLDVNFLQHTTRTCRYLHGGFVRLDTDEALLSLDGVTHLDQHFNDIDVFEIPNVRHFNRDQLAHASFSWRVMRVPGWLC